MRKALTGTALLFSLIGSTAVAQISGVPQEFPPEDFSGNQFVDSQGCAFIRAGISGNTQWVPRVNAQRSQLCNFQPTFDAVPEAPATESVVADASTDADLPIETASATPDGALPELPLITLPSSAEVAASNRAVTVPVSRTNTAPAPSPRVITSVAAPAPAPVEAPAVEIPEAAAPRLTQAQVCDGKFGLQPGFISSRTGETLDCGPAPAAVAAAAAPVANPGPEPLRMTMAEICEAAKLGDRKFVDASTGAPIICPAPVQVAQAAIATPAPVSLPAPVSAPAPAQVASACPEIPATVGHDVRCGPQTKRPWTAAGSDGTSARSRTASLGLGGTPVPASNPARGTVAAEPPVPAGYQRVFNDGRHNAQRGLPRTATQVSARSAPASVASPYKYIQVGSFGVPSNATNLLGRLQAMGLGTATGTGGGLKIVAVGPFTSAADMQNALNAVRAMGFPDAFPRN